MAVNVTKLWREGRFQTLELQSKLLYIYLITSPNLNTLGLLNTTPKSIQSDLNLDESEFRRACGKLRDSSFIVIFKVHEQVYFSIPNHFATLPKSVSVSKKAKKDLDALPQTVVDVMQSLALVPDIEKHVEFTAPTAEEIEAYAVSKGHLVDAKVIIDFYEGKARLFNKKGWYDSRGKAVKDWRGKLRSVWFRDENKLKECKGAPKGYEYFFVNDTESGNITPDYWKDGLPYTNGDFLQTKLLQREYKKRIA